MTADRTYWRSDLLVTGIAFCLLLAWDASGLDLALTRHFAGLDGFPWRDRWLTSSLLHEGGRVFAWAALALLIVNIWRPLMDGPSKAERVRWVLVTLVCLIVVPSIKRLSATSCPWDLAEFGGAAHYVSHWRFGLADGGPGHCFPSGHATSAFAFLVGAFALRPHRPWLARVWLVCVLAIGALFGWAQMARGAHYASHTFWTAWLCWTIAVIAAPRPHARPGAPAALPGQAAGA
jgi:membrane-associated PAP2 superfamily phosphatase